MRCHLPKSNTHVTLAVSYEISQTSLSSAAHLGWPARRSLSGPQFPQVQNGGTDMCPLEPMLQTWPGVC